MITEDLIAYIQAQLKKNIPEDLITSRLVDAGWHDSDIAEAFNKISKPQAPILNKLYSAPATPSNISPIKTINTNTILQKQEVDPYREQPDLEEPQAMRQQPSWTLSIGEVTKTAQSSYSVPMSDKKSEQEPEKPATKIIFAKSFSEANPVHIQDSFTAKLENDSTPVAETQQIIREIPVNTNEVTKANIEIRNEELMPNLVPKATSQVDTLIPKQPEIVITPAITPIMPKFTQPLISKNLSSFKDLKITPNIPTPPSKTVDNLPKSAMLYSYKQALSLANNSQQQSFNKKRNRLIKWLIAIIILGGGVFALAQGYVKIPSFIKKDPKTLLINAPTALAALTSYKIETDATISMPAFADITTGLISGQAVSVKDTDFVSFSAKGTVNNTTSTPAFDYIATITSSLLKNSIVTDLKYKNGTSFVTTPNLDEIWGMNTPATSVVIIPKNGFDPLVTIFPASIQNFLKEIDVDKVFSIGVPSYTNTDTTAVLKDFINNAIVIEKSPEDVHGVPSYHYELNADKQSTKNFLNRFVNVFTKNLTPNQVTNLDATLGAANMDSFEIWIGKGDSNIHQYKFNLSAPLSAILGLDDKGIAGNKVNLSFQTTYYDFNVPNTIELPTNTISINDFLKNVDDMKIKNSISSFVSIAKNMHNALGNYGKRSNPSGSCSNPNPSSLFSPVGQPKGASNSVGMIAGAINDLLGITSETMSCYSTPSAWALAAPLSSDPTTYFCADSTGATLATKIPLNGTVCK